MHFKTLFVTALLIFSLLLSLNCQKVEKVKQVEKLETEIEFNPIKEYRGSDDAHFEVYIKSNIGQPRARLNFFVDEVPQNPIELNDEGENLFTCNIPHQDKGTIVKYFLEITTATGTKIFFPKKAAEEAKFYTLVFKGEANKFLKLIHILLSIIPLILFVIATYFAFKHIKHGVSISKTLWLTVIAFLLFFIAVFPIGMIVEYQVYGKVWNGWPFGSDITHTKAFILFIYWLATLFLMKNSIFKKAEKNLVTDRVFAALVIIGTIITLALFVIPHENVRF
jgi:hypothetical protein